MSKQSSELRKSRLEQFGSLYEKAHALEGACVYCGEAAKNGLDHVPPLHAVEQFGPYDRHYLYDACGLCNCKLSAYPAACLVVRAEYLLCVLRKEWLILSRGGKRRWPKEQVAINGIAVKARLTSGAIRAVCRCKSCETIPEAKPFRKMGIPYAGKELTFSHTDWDYYDAGHTSGV